MTPKPYHWVMIDTEFLFEKLACEDSSVLKIAMYAAHELKMAGIDGSVVVLSKADIMEALGISEKTVERAVKRLVELKAIIRPGGKGSYEFHLTYARVGKTAAHKEAERTQKESTEASESRQMQRESWTWATQPNAEHANQLQEEAA